MNYQGAHFRIHQEAHFRIWEGMRGDVGGDVGAGGDAGGNAIT